MGALQHVATGLGLFAACACAQVQAPAAAPHANAAAPAPAAYESPQAISDWSAFQATDPRAQVRSSVVLRPGERQRVQAIDRAIAGEFNIGLWNGAPDVFAAGFRAKMLLRNRQLRPTTTPVERALYIEYVRAELETQLPWAASRLVEGQVRTFGAKVEPAALEVHDLALAKNLARIAESLNGPGIAGSGFDSIGALELSDWLDQLEKVALAFPRAQIALAALRVALAANESSPIAPPPSEFAKASVALLEGHGTKASADYHEAAAVLQAAERRLRTQLGSIQPTADELIEYRAYGRQMLALQPHVPAAWTQDPEVARISDLCTKQSEYMTPQSAPERLEACMPAGLAKSGKPALQAAGALMVHALVVRGLWAIQVAANRRVHNARTLTPQLLIDVQEYELEIIARRAAVRTGDCIVSALAALESLPEYPMNYPNNEHTTRR